MESNADIDIATEEQPRTAGIRYTLGRLFRIKLAMAGIPVLIMITIFAIFAPLIAPFDPTVIDGFRILEGPTWEHLLGMDHIGRDVFSRLIWGSRISMLVALFSIGLTLVIAVPLGLLSGYFGGLIDTVVMRIMDALYAFPALLLALALVAAMEPSIKNIIIAIGVIMIPTFSRLVRAQTLSIREWEYVLAARAMGATHKRIMLLYILPNVLAPIIVQASLGMAVAILAESALSYLGVGIRPPTPTWGMMLSEGFPYLEINPWLSIFPGLAIFVTVLAFNLVGDALRDVLDPRLIGTQ